MKPIKLSIPDEPLSLVQPSDFVPEKQKTRGWFEKQVRYLSLNYNPVSYSFDTAKAVTEKSNSGTDISNYNLRISDDMVNNFSYLFGQQPNINYAYLTMDATGQTFQSPWIKGRNAGKIIDFANGDMLDSLDAISFDATSLSKEVITKKNQIFDNVELAFDLKENGITGSLEEMGVSFKPYPKNFETRDDIEEEKNNYKDDLEDIAIEITEDVYNREKLKFLYSKAYLHTLCGLGAVYNYVVNGKVKKKLIPCFNTIFDNRKDDDFGTDMRYWGFVEYATPAEWLSRHPSLADIPGAVSEMQGISNNIAENLNQFTDYYNGSNNNNFRWWNMTGGKNEVAGITMFFIAPRDLGFKKAKSESGKNKIETIKQSEEAEQGQYLTEAIHKATLIGNKWCVDFGYEKNVLRDFYNKGKPIPNMSFFIPGMLFGQPRPVMTMIKKNQDEIDRLGFVLRDLQGGDLGKILIVNAAVMGEAGKDAIAFADDLKNNKVLVARTSGEMLQLTRDMKAVEMVDLSNNSNLLQYLNLKHEEERVMEETVGLSKAALGAQKAYVSGQVQEQSASYGSNVMKYVVDGFFGFIRRDLQLSMNIQKILIADGKDKDGNLVVGDKGVKLLKSIDKKRRFEDLLLYIKVQDRIDEQTRATILNWGQMFAANPEKSGLNPDDLLVLLDEKSIGQMIRKLRMAIKKNKMEQRKEQTYIQTIEMLKQQMAQQQNQMIALSQEQGRNTRHGLDKQAQAAQMMADMQQPEAQPA